MGVGADGHFAAAFGFDSKFAAAQQGHAEKWRGVHDQSLNRVFDPVPYDPSEAFDGLGSERDSGFREE